MTKAVSFVGSARLAIERVATDICFLNFRETVCVLTLLLLGFYGEPNAAGGYYTPIIILAMIPALLHRPLLKNPYIWLFVALAYSVAFLRNWYPIDNHKYVILYWLVVLTFASVQFDKDFENFLEKSARFLLVFVMGAAAFQKLTQSTYVDSSFFEMELLTDPRFETLAVLFNADRADLAYNRDAMYELQLAYLGRDVVELSLREFAAVKPLAFAITWWDALVQVAIALCFTVRRRRTDLIAHILLLCFIVTTYFFAPVIGFGWIIALLAFAVSSPLVPSLRIVYLPMFPLLAIYDMPWDNLLTRFI